MEERVRCPCGHGMADHDRDGCRGEHGRPCACTRDRFAALVASVADAERRAFSRTPAV